MADTDEVLVVVSGLPASGKTTLGRALSDRFSMPLLDKDDVLEALFDSLGSTTPEERSRLSRAADEVLFTLAPTMRRALLVNWWHPETAVPRLRALARPLVEVHCACPPDVAAQRFVARRRHPGHLDDLRSPEERLAHLQEAAARQGGPLGLGRLVTVDTTRAVDDSTVHAQVREALERAW